ncbi:MAG: sugar phosphate isomerase/epimerase [bacterium]
MRRWAVCDADWNHRADGLADAEIWPAAVRAGFAGIEAGVRSAAADLAPARLAERVRLAATYRLPVRAVLLCLPADRWPQGALTGDVQRVVTEVAACASACVRLRLDLLGVAPDADDDAASWSRLIAGLARVRDIAAARGVGVAVQYAPGTAVADCADAIRLATDVPGTGVLLNTGHAWAAGEDPAQSVRRLGNLLWHVHLSDGGLPLGRQHDVSAVVDALDAGYVGLATVDASGAGVSCTGVEAAAESLQATRR